MRILKPVLALTLSAIFALNGGCSTAAKQKQLEESWSAARLYEESHKALKRGDAAAAVHHLESLQVRFPLEDYAKQAQLDIILAYFQREEYDYAITSADQFIRLNPQSPNSAYPWYMKGRSELARTKGIFDKFVPKDIASTDQRLLNVARSHFDHVARHFPNSRWAEPSRLQAEELVDKMAEHELSVAQFYLERGAYVGAANRIQAMLTRYPDTKLRTKALKTLAECYEKQGLKEQSEMIKKNLPA